MSTFILPLVTEIKFSKQRIYEILSLFRTRTADRPISSFVHTQSSGPAIHNKHNSNASAMFSQKPVNNSTLNQNTGFSLDHPPTSSSPVNQNTDLRFNLSTLAPISSNTSPAPDSFTVPPPAHATHSAVNSAQPDTLEIILSSPEWYAAEGDDDLAKYHAIQTTDSRKKMLAQWLGFSRAPEEGIKK
jgi:hypothetical protein